MTLWQATRFGRYWPAILVVALVVIGYRLLADEESGLAALPN